MTTAVSTATVVKEYDDDTHRRAGAYALRFDRRAGWVALISAIGWAAFLIRDMAGVGGLPVEAGLKTLRIEHADLATLLPFGLVAWMALSAAVGAALLRGVRRSWTAGRLFAALGIGLGVAFFLLTRDFGGALLIGGVYGFMLTLLSRNAGAMLAFPSLVWLGVFFVLPLVGVVVFSFGRTTDLGQIDVSTPSLEHYARIISPVGVSGLVYVNIIVRTVYVALLTTVICLVIGYPFAFWIAKQPERLRNVLLMLVMIPFWTNILIRTYAWVIILRRDGLINNFLIDVLGVINRPLELMNTPGALLLGLVYGYLPFMVLPLYASIERLDKRYTEAAHDLYANPFRAFVRVVLPLTLPGIIAGSILVFIPVVGSYVVSNVLGGGKFFLIGNLLEQQFIGSSGDKAFGAAFGVVLTVLMLGATLVYFRLGRKAALT